MQNSKHFNSSDIANNSVLKTPLTSNFPNCLTILCYCPHCIYEVCKYIFHFYFVLFSVHDFCCLKLLVTYIKHY